MNKTTRTDSNNISTIWVVIVLCAIFLIVVGSYVVNFNFDLLINGDWQSLFHNLSNINGNWGTFGDYIGGILNPVIAAFAFYLIAKTYELQKKELEETRKLLKVSTDAQEGQIKLAALTALLNSNLTRINLLKLEQDRLLGILPDSSRKKNIIYYTVADVPKEFAIKDIESKYYGDKPEYLYAAKRSIHIIYELQILSEKAVRLEQKIDEYSDD